MERIKEYVGPEIQIHPDDLYRYENDNWIAEEKRDGSWAYLKTDDEGIVRKVVGRTGIDFNRSDVKGIKGVNLGLPNSIIIGELETGSQASTKLHRVHGFRRFHVFDFYQLKGENTTLLNYNLRRKLVVIIGRAVLSKNPEIAKRFLIVRQQKDNFKAFYKEVMANGGEGLVLKKVDSVYKSLKEDGKTSNWIRVKKDRFLDAIVMNHKLSKKGFNQLDIGIWDDGKVRRVQTILCPKGYEPEELVGQVIEVRGAEMMESGAIRHGRFERVRNDKTKEMCTL